MSSVTRIENAIQKLSVDEQRTIALHLSERLIDQESPGGWASPDEGIRHLPQYEACPASRESKGHKSRHHAQTTR